MNGRRLCQLALLVGVIAPPGGLGAQEPRFYPDDPLTREPLPYPTNAPEARALSAILEVVGNTLGRPGERHPQSGVIPSGGVNTLGEVLDGPWFVNRHATRRLSREALVRGSRTAGAPSPEGAWQVLAVKPYGFRPGMLIGDGRQRYLLLFDDPGSPEVSTAAQVVSSHILHAIGYHVPECHIVTFPRERLVVAEGAEILSSAGNKRPLTEADIDGFLKQVARIATNRYRAVAIHASPPDATRILGPYQVFSTRSDDPNDVVPHEHRRDLRGLFVIASWINLAAARAISTMDLLIDDGVVPPHIQHYILELWSSLGGSELKGPRRAWDGNDPMFDANAALRNVVGFGVWSPAWMRARYPRLRGVGQFESDTFDPPRWAAIERLAPFENRLPDDEYWGAKQVMAFTDDDIRALVSTGEYSDPAAAEWIARTLSARRDKIGRHYFANVLPLDAFRIQNGQLSFDDLGERYGITRTARTYTVRWFRLVNDTGKLLPLDATDSLNVPTEVERAPVGDYYAVRISAAGEHLERTVTAYLRTGAAGDHQVVGVVRSWPGKALVDPNRDAGTATRRFAGLAVEQQQLYVSYAMADAEARGRTMTAEEHFETQAISERTTYDAVTHALLNSTLTDAQGRSLGRALDLVASLERVAGQYYGRSGDQQFRLYVTLKPDALDTLRRSVEFFPGHENSVYHVGYPNDFRQAGKVPNMQFSVSEDGLQADIDVDYRSSRLPQALFNGHLSAANSDVRAGNNVERHNGRWAGMTAWWQRIFGSLPSDQEGPRDALAEAALAEVTTPLPPDRPRGSPIEQVQDAVQEFLTDWLVRRKIDEALTFLSDRPAACVNVDDDAEYEALDAGRTRAALEETMHYVLDKIERPDSLTEAIDTVLPVKPDRRVVAHMFEGEFSLIELSLAEASQYMCAQSDRPRSDRTYYGAVFRFKHRDGGTLGLLWTQEAGAWRLVSFQALDI
jgi:hypothetical protein